MKGDWKLPVSINALFIAASAGVEIVIDHIEGQTYITTSAGAHLITLFDGGGQVVAHGLWDGYRGYQWEDKGQSGEELFIFAVGWGTDNLLQLDFQDCLRLQIQEMDGTRTPFIPFREGFP